MSPKQPRGLVLQGDSPRLEAVPLVGLTRVKTRRSQRVSPPIRSPNSRQFTFEVETTTMDSAFDVHKPLPGVLRLRDRRSFAQRDLCERRV